MACKRADQDLHNATSTQVTLAIQNPNGALMYSTHSGTLGLNSILTEACKAHVVPNLTSNPLISNANLCNANCKVIFDKKAVKVQLNRQIKCFEHGGSDGLWQL